MIRVRVLDTPGARSAHDRPTPRGGGVGSTAGFVLGSLLALGPAPDLATRAVLLATSLLALAGWLDDVRQFPPWFKLAAQLAAAMLVLGASLPLPGPVFLPLFGLAWLVFATNALNFIDGLNGLASGAALLFGLLLAASLPPAPAAALGLMLAAGLLGFLPFNYPRARIFLGDVGSQSTGLVLGSLVLMRWRDAGVAGAMLPVLMLAGILYDVTFTLVRRVLAGERLVHAHHGHLYQVARRSGLPAWQVSLIHWGFVVWGAVAARALAHAPLLAAALVMAPQLGWTALVARRARRAGLGRW